MPGTETAAHLNAARLLPADGCGEEAARHAAWVGTAWHQLPLHRGIIEWPR